MTRSILERPSGFRFIQSGIVAAIALCACLSEAAYADEGGVSYWLPGRFSSLAATPQVPGWSMAEVYYHTTVSAFGAVAAAREIQIGRFSPIVNVSLNASLNAQADLVLLNPTYTFASPVLGGQLAVGMTGLFGRNAPPSAERSRGFGQFAAMRMGSFGDSITSFGDLYPQATLKWNAGVNNFMTYLTGDIPVGAYDPPASPISASATPPSTAAAATPSSIRRPDMNFRPLRASPTISRIKARNTRTASTSISTGARRSSLEAGFCWPRRIRVSAGHRRFWPTPDPRRIQVSRCQCRSADRISVSGRRHAGLSQSEGIWRIRRRQPACGMEHVADVLDLADGACQHPNADAANGDEVRCAIRTRSTSSPVAAGSLTLACITAIRTP